MLINIVPYILGISVILYLMYRLKGVNKTGELLRRLVLFWSIIFFILSLIIIAFIIINGLGFPKENRIQIIIVLIIIMTICSALFFKNKI